ncbi:MAG: UvrD-helicase domain-containing protein [bacterium]
MWTKQQKQAIDEFGTNILVSAGAGSGKTAVLTTRITQHLSKMNIDELLVLTFTEAAAAEMKQRVRKKIIDENLLDQLPLLDQAYITTFDSFNLSVVKKYHYLVNVKRNISIADASMMILYKQQLIDEMFEELYSLREEKFIKFMTMFTFKKDDGIKEIILKINDNLDLKYDKVGYLNNYIKNQFNKDNVNNLITEYLNLLNEEVKSLYSPSSEFLGFGYDKMNQEINKITILASDYQDYNTIKDFVETFKFPRMVKDADEEAKELNKLMKDIFSKLSKKLIYENEEELLECINQTKDYNEVIVDILLKFDSKVNEFKFQRDLYEFNDIAKLALNLVKNFDVVKNDMKSKFKEILVDEYQDTSDLQEEFITAISTNNIYCVGDIKQSIYRFRNANPYNFQSKYLDYKENKGGIKIDLLENFRSRKEVLDNINLLFEDLMSIKHGAANYRDGHFMVDGNRNYDATSNKFYDMEFLTYTKDEYKNDEYEAFIIANKINEYVKNKVQVFNGSTTRDCTYSDFAILIDRASAFELFRKVLSYNQIQTAVYKEEVLTSSVILKVISNLFNLVANFSKLNDDFKFSYASISRSFLTDNDDNDLLKDLLNNFEDTYITNTIKEIGFKINSCSPLTIYYELLEKFNFYESIIKIPEIQNSLFHLEYLHDIITNLSDSGYDIHMINTYFKDILSNQYDLKVKGATPENGVKIMTIHKSKGLEFPFIFMPGLQKKFNTFELKDLISYDAKYGIVTPYFNNGIKDNFIKNLIVRNYILEDISEKIRLFYVSLTRAKEKMFFVCENFENDKEVEIHNMNNFKQFLYYNYDKIEKYLVNTKVEIDEDYKITKEKSYQSYIKKQDVKVKQFDTKYNKVFKHKISKELDKVIDNNLRKNIDFGLRLHQILETIDFKSQDISNFNLTKEETDIINGILKLEIFNSPDSEYYQELEFIYEKDKESFHGIIDLLVITKKEVLIVDYKLKNVKHKEYQDQLNVYKDYIKTITDKPIKMYLLSILNKELTEVKEK